MALTPTASSRSFVGSVIVAAVVATSTPTFAQGTRTSSLPPEPEAFNLTPFIGAGFSGNLENVPVAFGAALGYGWSPRLVFEGEVYFAPNAKQGVISEFDTSVWALSANVLYHFVNQSDRATPYVVTGLGVLTGDAEVSPNIDDTSSVLSWNFGAGVKTAMSRRWGLRADLRYFTGDDFAPDHWRIYGGVVLRRIGLGR